MKALVAVLVGLAVAVSAHVAAAYVVVVATAVPITSAATTDRTQLGNAVQSAIRDVLDHAIGFTPTVVTLQNAKVVGDRLYLLLFIADEDGESTIEALSGGGASQPGQQRFTRSQRGRAHPDEHARATDFDDGPPPLRDGCTSPRWVIGVQPMAWRPATSALVICATCRPWKRAILSSFAETGRLLPSALARVEAP